MREEHNRKSWRRGALHERGCCTGQRRSVYGKEHQLFRIFGTMDVDFDLSDVGQFFDEGKWEVEKEMIDVGDASVKYAEDNGNYQDHTLTLRTSNKYDVDETGLTLYNDATSPNGYQYASKVESKGFEVLSGAALYAERELKKRFEK